MILAIRNHRTAVPTRIIRKFRVTIECKGELLQFKIRGIITWNIS